MLPCISDELLSEFSQELNLYLQKRFQYLGQCTQISEETISVRRKKVYMYLRFRTSRHWPAETLVVANLGFLEQRQGHAHALLTKFTECAAKFGYTQIGFEHASVSLSQFAKKHGFTNYRDSINWLIPVETLELALASSRRPPPVRANLKGRKA